MVEAYTRFTPFYYISIKYILVRSLLFYAMKNFYVGLLVTVLGSLILKAGEICLKNTSWLRVIEEKFNLDLGVKEPPVQVVIPELPVDPRSMMVLDSLSTMQQNDHLLFTKILDSYGHVAATSQMPDTALDAAKEDSMSAGPSVKELTASHGTAGDVAGEQAYEPVEQYAPGHLEGE